MINSICFEGVVSDVKETCFTLKNGDVQVVCLNETEERFRKYIKNGAVLLVSGKWNGFSIKCITAHLISPA